MTEYSDRVVRLVRLITGEEVIATVEITDNGLIMNQCLQVVVQPGDKQDPKTGKIPMQLGFLPWAILAKDDIFIGHAKIMYYVEPEEQLKDSYLSMFRKVQIPPKTLVLAR